jgi:predicted ATPase
MISRIEALGFRSLRDVRQDLAPFQVLVGPNGSGKSSFLDVLAFLGDMLVVGPRKAILGDSAARVPTRAEDPSHLCWMREADHFELAVELVIPARLREALTNGQFERARYEVAVTAGSTEAEVELSAETLWLLPASEDRPEGAVQRTLFPELRRPRPTLLHESNKKLTRGWRKVVNKVRRSGTHNVKAETTSWSFPLKLGGKAGLANLPEDETRFPVATWAKHVLMEGVQRVALNAEAMRRPSPPGGPKRFLPDGSNLPWVVHELHAKAPERFRRWVAHVRTALPDMKTVKTQVRLEDRRRYLVMEYANGLKAPSWVISDGTLRLLALTLLAFLPDADGVYLVEEPENGIHPRAVETVYEALSAVRDAQVLCASHSPVVLGLARPKDLLCFAHDEAGAVDIVRGDHHPCLRDWKGTLNLGTLFASGVLG